MADKKDGKDNTLKYSFTGDELNFLTARQEVVLLASVVASDVKAVMNNFILNMVYPRLGLDPQKINTTYDIVKGELTVTPKIIVPDANITNTIATAKH